MSDWKRRKSLDSYAAFGESCGVAAVWVMIGGIIAREVSKMGGKIKQTIRYINTIQNILSKKKKKIVKRQFKRKTKKKKKIDVIRVHGK